MSFTAHDQYHAGRLAFIIRQGAVCRIVPAAWPHACVGSGAPPSSKCSSRISHSLLRLIVAGNAFILADHVGSRMSAQEKLSLHRNCTFTRLILPLTSQRSQLFVLFRADPSRGTNGALRLKEMQSKTEDLALQNLYTGGLAYKIWSSDVQRPANAVVHKAIVRLPASKVCEGHNFNLLLFVLTLSRLCSRCSFHQ